MLSREETHKGYAELLTHAKETNTLYAMMRKLAQEDLFFLLYHVLHRKDMDDDWIFARCREVQNSPNGFIDLWAREHYKSTVLSFGLTIQDILNDPELTVCFLCFNRPQAKDFLAQIKREFESNETLKKLFPDILYADPKRESPKWSEDDGIIVKRTTNPREATIEAYGLTDGQPTGKHYKLIVYDDVVTDKSVKTPTMMETTTKAWELSLNLISRQGGRRRYVGTRYHHFDTYKTIIDRGAAIPRIYPATDDGTPFGNPVLLTKEELEEKKQQGDYTFACQQLLDPKAGGAIGFDRTWLKYWKIQNIHHFNRYILVDPANEKKKNSDYTAMWCIGLGADENYYVIDMLRDRINLTERTNVLFDWHVKYRPLGVGYEKYGKDTDIEHIEYVQGERNYHFHVQPLGGSMSKYDRMCKLIPLFQRGRIFLPERCMKTDYNNVMQDLVKEFIEKEYEPFPVLKHDDMLDCLARIRDPEFVMTFPFIRMKEPALTQAEQDWKIITGHDGGDSAWNMNDGISVH